MPVSLSLPFPGKPDTALLIIGHGASTDPYSGAPTRAHAATIAATGGFSRVATAFWKEEPAIRTALAAIPEREIYVVPNFISEGYYTQTVIPRELGITGGKAASHRLEDGRLLHYCAPVGSHAAMTELLLQRVRECAPGVALHEASLIIVGHGTKRNANSATAARRQAEKIASMGLFREVSPAYIDEAPQIAHWREQAMGRVVIVVPFFIADGLHSFSDIPRMIGLPPLTAEGGERGVLSAPYPLEGRELYYGSAVGTDPRFASLILEQVAQFDQTKGDS